MGLNNKNPFDDAKRQWKRYDPEPPESEKGCDQCEWREWELYVWIVTVLVAIFLLSHILGGAAG